MKRRKIKIRKEQVMEEVEELNIDSINERKSSKIVERVSEVTG